MDGLLARNTNYEWEMIQPRYPLGYLWACTHCQQLVLVLALWISGKSKWVISTYKEWEAYGGLTIVLWDLINQYGFGPTKPWER
jgi:hypothetical protein